MREASGLLELQLLERTWGKHLDNWKKRGESVRIAGESVEKALGLLKKGRGKRQD